MPTAIKPRIHGAVPGYYSLYRYALPGDDLSGYPYLSRDYGISKEHLSRTFKECMGTTFKKYLTSIRMHHAYQDLTESDYSILQIALTMVSPTADPLPGLSSTITGSRP